MKDAYLIHSGLTTEFSKLWNALIINTNKIRRTSKVNSLARGGAVKCNTRVKNAENFAGLDINASTTDVIEHQRKNLVIESDLVAISDGKLNPNELTPW